ncbi:MULTISPECIES: VOC family protein [Streptomyces]|uniref:VOC family protein n=1 Tax=Streptomyces TaxID=1883 RepID=UPI00163C4C0B|nr:MULTISPECIES: VOC family protein [Streptomyces]MBC2876901.1 VOC family protein [Streptomyces sp. TYQ1024]UBI35928.1 VOC family protein [Streptomyces mobaraensis]UKW28521.1 VOC family protein [Streptomyces sp. TYQ1024]
MRVSSLLHYGLQVPDLGRGKDFYTDFGLTVDERGSSLAVRCAERPVDRTLLTEGPEKRLHHVAFGVPAGALPAMQRHLEGAGVRLEDAPSSGVEGGLWFRDPDGTLVAVLEEPSLPAAPAGAPPMNLPGDYRRKDEARWPAAGAPARPRRLGHVLVFSPDPARTEAFYTRILGLGVSDRVPGVVTFLNTGPGDHHVFGLVKSTHPGLHHSSWEVGSVDEMVIGARNLAERGSGLGWGLGRHTFGSNLFHYIRDPWGSWIEYFLDMDQITENWRPRDWQDVPSAVWCPLRPAEFTENLEPRK